MESGRRKLSETTSFLVVLEFRTGFVDLQRACFVRTISSSPKDSSGFLAKLLHAVPGGAGRSKILGNTNPQDPRLPKATQDDLSLLPRCGNGKIKQRVGCLPPRGFSLVPR